MEFGDYVEPIHTSDKYYDLLIGGYIKPLSLLKNVTDVATIEEAIMTINIFLNELEENGLLIEISPV